MQLSLTYTIHVPYKYPYDDQTGTRELLECCLAAHSCTDGRPETGIPPLIIICGESLSDWTRRIFTSDNEVSDLFLYDYYMIYMRIASLLLLVVCAA
jgi:hypothetical protein